MALGASRVHRGRTGPERGRDTRDGALHRHREFAKDLRALAFAKLPRPDAAVGCEFIQRHDALGAVDDPVVAVRVAAEPGDASVGGVDFRFEPFEEGGEREAGLGNGRLLCVGG